MKKIIFILLGISTLFLTGCSNIKTLNYKSLKQKLNNKETFILEVAKTNCSHCKEFTPRLNKILKKYNIKAYKIYTDKFSKKEREKFNSIMYISGTPTVVFIEKGKETDTYNRIVGAVSNIKVIKKLKQMNYIK